ncbi:MAG TPA: hypothetical protein VIC51_01220 [Psychromonas sp.]
MAYFKLLNTSNKKLSKQLFRKSLLLFIVLLSGHSSGNQLPAQVRLGLDQPLVTQSTSLLALEHKTSPMLESHDNQQIKKSLLQENTMTLPQAGMASDLYQKIGFWMLLCAAIFWIAERHFINVKTDNPWQGGSNGIIKSQKKYFYFSEKQ